MELGLHLSIAGAIDSAVDRAVEKGCNTLQMFSRNPRGWNSKKLDLVEIESFKIKAREHEIWPIFIHMPYLVNLASPKDKVYRNSSQVLKDELLRAAQLRIPFVVTHLGSHLGHGKKKGLQDRECDK